MQDEAAVICMGYFFFCWRFLNPSGLRIFDHSPAFAALLTFDRHPSQA